MTEKGVGRFNIYLNKTMENIISLEARVEESDSQKRIDVVAALYFKNFSRSTIQKRIKEENLRVNGKIIKPKILVSTGDLITVRAIPEKRSEDVPQKLDLDILFEDLDLIIIDKPHGLVVHPGAGNRDKTLMNGLLNYEESLSYLPRAGVVHRLDKDTSGLMVVAKNEASYMSLVKQLKDRSVRRNYSAVVVGEPISGDTINLPIGRHPKIRTKQAVNPKGKEAITEFKVVKRMKGYSLLSISLKTGRTHQIRVHLSYRKFPIVGDRLYGGGKFAAKTSEETKSILKLMTRQALHASSLSFVHPKTSESIKFQSNLPSDMSKLVNSLEARNA